MTLKRGRTGKPFHLIASNPVFKAFARNPMPVGLQITQAIDARESYTNVRSGKSNDDDRQVLVGLANVVMVLAEKHCEPEDLAVAQAAQMALLRADGRVLQGKAWGFDYPGWVEVLAAIEMFEDMVATMGQGDVADALLTVLRRNASGHLHKVELV